MSKAMSGLENRSICARVQLCIFVRITHYCNLKLNLFALYEHTHFALIPYIL
jgi:hypothetical protein